MRLRTMRNTFRTIRNLMGLGYAAPQRYWERRYRRHGRSVTAPGCIDLDVAANEEDYEVKWRSILAAVTAGNLQRCASVLDAGCGNGVLTQLMVNHGWQVTAVDFAPSAIEAARQRVGQAAEWHCCPIESFAPDRRFDVVLNVDVLHHVVDDRSFLATLDRLCALVSPGGLLLVNTHLAEEVTQRGVRPTHVRWRSLSEFSGALPAGWAISSRASYWLPREGVTKDLLTIRNG